MSPLRRDSIHSITVSIRRCSCLQVCLKIQRTIQWWQSMVQRHCMPDIRVWWMLSAWKMKKLNRMWPTAWYRLQWLAKWGGCKNRNKPMGNHSIGYRMRLHTSSILSGIRTSKYKSRLWGRDALHRVLQEQGAYIDGGWHVFRGGWETPRVAITIPRDGIMNGHSILRSILQFPDWREIHLCPFSSTNLWSIPNLTK